MIKVALNSRPICGMRFRHYSTCTISTWTYWTLIDAFWFSSYFSLLIVTSNNGEYMEIKHSVNVVNSWAPPLIFSNIYYISMCKLVSKMLDIAYHVLMQSSSLRTVYHVNESISLRKVVHENTFNMI